MKVYKFGGASVRNADGVRNLHAIIEGESELFVVVSAMGKTTNALERVFEAVRNGDAERCRCEIDECRAYHQTIVSELFSEGYRVKRADEFFDDLCRYISENRYDEQRAEEWYDRIVAYGELVSTSIVSEYLGSKGIANCWLDMRECFVTQPRHKDADVSIETSAPLLRQRIAAADARIFVGQGFIGSTPDGHTTTLGREGSDYSAAVAANIIDAESMTVWKDVDGILNADPRIFRDAYKIDELNYVDTIELAYSGAQIIHPKTIKPLQNKNIPLHVRPFGDKTARGTVIDGTAPTVCTPIIILKRNQSLLTLRSRDLSFVLEEKFPVVFSTLERFRIKCNLIHNTAIALSLCVEESWHLEQAARALQGEGFDTEIADNIELLTIHHCKGADIDRYMGDAENILISQTTPDTIRVVRLR